MNRVALFGCGGALCLTLTALAMIDARADYVSMLGLVSVASLAYVAALWLTSRWQGSRGELIACLGLALMLRVPLMLAAPVLSDDIYRYVWDGRVQRHGHNPFVSAPADPALAHLQTDVTRLIHPTNAALPTIYPPAAQLFFRGVTAVHESVGALLTALLVCDALIVLILWRWLREVGRSEWGVLAYAWHPLVAIEGAGGGHIDLLGTLLIVAAGWLLTKRRTRIAAVAFVLAVAVKYLPIVLAPLFWRRVRTRDLVAAVAVGVGLYLPFMSAESGVPLGSLGTYAEEWRFNGPLFAWVEQGLGIMPTLGLAALTGLAVAAYARTRLDVSAPAAWAWPIAANVLLMPAIYPWHLLWVTPFLTVWATAPLVAWTLGSLLTYAVWGPELSGQGWVLPSWVLPAEYGLVCLVALWWLLAARGEARF